MQQTSTITDLTQELNSLKVRLELSDNKRKKLENDSQSSHDRNLDKIRSLESKLADLVNDRDAQQLHYETKLKEMKSFTDQEVERIKNESQVELNKLVNDYEARLNLEKAQMQEKMLTLERVS